MSASSTSAPATASLDAAREAVLAFPPFVRDRVHGYLNAKYDNVTEREVDDLTTLLVNAVADHRALVEASAKPVTGIREKTVEERMLLDPNADVRPNIELDPSLMLNGVRLGDAAIDPNPDRRADRVLVTNQSPDSPLKPGFYMIGGQPLAEGAAARGHFEELPPVPGEQSGAYGVGAGSWDAPNGSNGKAVE